MLVRLNSYEFSYVVYHVNLRSAHKKTRRTGG